MVLTRVLCLVGVLAVATSVAAQDTPIQPAAQHMICDSGCGSPPASADGTAFVAGTTNVSLIGAAFNDALADVVAGKYAAPRITKQRAIHVNFRDATGAEIPFPAALSGGGFAVTCISGCSGGTTDTDDGSVATGQVTGLSLGLTQVYDGAVWRRLTIGTAGSASAQVLSVQGVGGGTPLPVSGTFWQATQPVSTAAPTTVLNGQTNVTTAGTRVVLAASTTAQGVTICAKSTNTGNIFVGSATVSSSNGRILRPGECQSLAIANLNTVNLDSAVNGEGVSYVGVN